MPRGRVGWIGRLCVIGCFVTTSTALTVWHRESRLVRHPICAVQMSELRGLVLAGPDPKAQKVVRWRCLDLREEVIQRFSATVPERTIAKWLRKLKLTRLQPRPFHPKRDEAAQEALKKLRRAAENSLALQHRGDTG
jgi:hypothetical protein